MAGEPEQLQCVGGATAPTRYIHCTTHHQQLSSRAAVQPPPQLWKTRVERGLRHAKDGTVVGTCTPMLAARIPQSCPAALDPKKSQYASYLVGICSLGLPGRAAPPHRPRPLLPLQLLLLARPKP